MSGTVTTKSMLPQFIKYLEKENLAELKIRGGDDFHFWNRFKIQKYAFLAKRFGLDLPYEHDTYVWGPSSSTLAGECYELEQDPGRYREARPELPREFRSGEFLGLVRGRSNDWLEIATTLLAVRKNVPKRDELVQVTEGGKDGIAREFIDATLRDLEGAGLIECDR